MQHLQVCRRYPTTACRPGPECGVVISPEFRRLLALTANGFVALKVDFSLDQNGNFAPFLNVYYLAYSC